MELKNPPLSRSYTRILQRDSEEQFVEHLLARQQKVHGSFTEASATESQVWSTLKEKARAVGDAVWAFCHIIPNGGTYKFLCAWRGRQKVNDVLQYKRLYVLDTSQKIQFEGMKKSVPKPWNWAEHQPFGLDQNVAIIGDPYSEDTNEEITSDIS